MPLLVRALSVLNLNEFDCHKHGNYYLAHYHNRQSEHEFRFFGLMTYNEHRYIHRDGAAEERDTHKRRFRYAKAAVYRFDFV